jgi:ribosomal protein S18 acetylase RimI-like enzyme
VDESAGPSEGSSIWPVYDAVFADHADYGSWRKTVWDPHTVRDGFRLVRAYQEEAVVGFAYGYTGAYGQWWTDNVSAALDPEVADQWLGGHFELVSIGVAATSRRQGIARRLMHALLEDLPHDRLLLMTSADPDDPARLLYASEGWSVLGPGTTTDKVTMGRRAGDTGEKS